MALTLEALEKFEPVELERRSYGYWCRKLREGVDKQIEAHAEEAGDDELHLPAPARAHLEERVEADNQAELYRPSSTPSVSRERSSGPGPELPDERKPISYQAPESPAASSFLPSDTFRTSNSPEIMPRASTSTAKLFAPSAARPSHCSPSPVIRSHSNEHIEYTAQQRKEQGEAAAPVASTSLGARVDKGKGKAKEQRADEKDAEGIAVAEQRATVIQELPRRSKRRRTGLLAQQAVGNIGVGEDRYESSSDVDEGPESEEEEGADPAPPDDPRHGKMGPHPPPKVAYWYRDWVTVVSCSPLLSRYRS
ncbi:hypothetical protein BCR35DRAFT_121714 [Leucosporidium creatinivorum]|uniref:Uncharacterized protein n=1 Tax=Leucosporidium creatinivorum TaxID=106004 RepID=A0A1Y2EZR1_9BASI|nr:hypothetical protein BCR35DRAFT_121714 [Leucosporidium creatinivorum]